MGMMKWAALGGAATVFFGPKLLGAYVAFPVDSATVEGTRYLVERYKAAPGRTADLIRQQTSVCLSEHIGAQASADLDGFFGEVMVYLVRHAERDRHAFVSGYRALAEREGPAIDGRIAMLSVDEKALVAALAGDLGTGPRSMAGCVARKLKAAV